ncbi:MAG: putative repeat protein (TIGR01451 family), partial [Myxococcota bacterium]
MLTRLFTLVAGLCVVAPLAVAAPVVNHDQGFWTDDFRDALGVLPVAGGASDNLEHQLGGRLFTLADNMLPGVLETTVVTPSSSSGWRDIALLYTASTLDGVTASAIDPATGTVYPLTLAPSADAAFTADASLASVPATVSALRIRLDLGDSPIAPTVQALRVRWHPRAGLGLAVSGAASACTNDTAGYRVNLSVSYASARGLVAWARVPQSDTFSPTFVDASNGGKYTATGVTIGGVQVAARSVYWDLGERAPGSTFALTYNLRYATGIPDTTAFDTQAFADASNALPVAADGPATVVSSAPAPFIEISASPTYYLGGQYHARTDVPLTWTISGGNFRRVPNRCGEPYRAGVLYTELASLLPFTPTGGVTDIDPGDGTYTDVAVAIDGVDVPANSVYWVIGDVAVGGRFSQSFVMQVATDATISHGDVVTDAAHLRHGSARRAADAVKDVVMGIPVEPRGQFALGDTVRGRTEIRALRNDNDQSSIGYGDTVSFRPTARNDGASTLNDVVMIVEIPDGASFDTASADAAGTTIYYNTAAGTLEALPDHDVSTAVFAGSWSTDVPAEPGTVTFVAFVTDALASTVFPQTGLTNSVLGDVRVRAIVPTGLPDGACPETVLTARALFGIYGYTPVGDTDPLVGPAASGGTAIDTEPIQVITSQPDLRDTRVNASPKALQPGEPLVFSVEIENRSLSGGPVDTGLNPTATLTLPHMNVNGVDTYLSCTVTDADGGTVDYSQAPETLTLSWPIIEPNGRRQVTVGCSSPVGIVNDTRGALSVRVLADDDICGTVSAVDADFATFNATEDVVLTKDVDFSVISPGAEFTYTLRLANRGKTPALGTWVVDHVPSGTELVAARAIEGGPVWFSATSPPGLPVALDPLDRITPQRVAQHFVAGVDIGDGWYAPTGGTSETLWIAFSMDDPTLSPTMVVTGGGRTAQIRVRAAADSLVGDVITNEGATFTDNLIQAIGERTRTIISALPSLKTTATCSEIVSQEEVVTLTLTYLNDSTNNDDVVSVDVTLPAGLMFDSFSHSYSAQTAAAHPGAVQPTATVEDATLTLDVTAGLGGPLGPGEGGVMTITALVDSGVSSGTLVTSATGGTATNAEGGLRLESSCTTLVTNADLGLDKAINNAAPRSGDRVTYTLIVRNEGGHPAADVLIGDLLPAGISYAPASVQVLAAGWSIDESVGLDGTLRWRLLRDGAETQDFPGQAGPIYIAFDAFVGDLEPGTTVENCATVSTSTAEDDGAANTGCVSFTTPLPDPWVLKGAPGLVAPAERFAYRLDYGNRNNEDARGVVLIDTLPDGAVAQPGDPPNVALTPADGEPDVVVTGAFTSNGEVVWYLDGDLTNPAPDFDLVDPSASGWTQSLAGLSRVTHVAVVVGDLPALSGPYSVLVDVGAETPDGVRPIAGTRFDNRVTIGSFSDPATRDADETNNIAWATTQTPGIDLAASAVCDPAGALPGVRPGDILTAT